MMRRLCFLTLVAYLHEIGGTTPTPTASPTVVPTLRPTNLPTQAPTFVLPAHITTFAGENGDFRNPQDVAVYGDDVYVADGGKRQIKIIYSWGGVRVISGSGSNGNSDGVGTSASFSFPASLVRSPDGEFYVADSYESNIRKIVRSTRETTTLAGSGADDFVNGEGTQASFHGPTGLTISSDGATLFVADFQNSVIRRITSSGLVSTFAGFNFGFADGVGTAARFRHPSSVALTSSGVVFVTDQNNNCIRRITSSGVVTTIAGNRNASFADGYGTEAGFTLPSRIAIGANDLLYVTETGSNAIRVVTQNGFVRTLAGDIASGFTNGYGTEARFSSPEGMTVMSNGDLLIADSGNGVIRRASLNGYQEPSHKWTRRTKILVGVTCGAGGVLLCFLLVCFFHYLYREPGKTESHSKIYGTVNAQEDAGSTSPVQPAAVVP